MSDQPKTEDELNKEAKARLDRKNMVLGWAIAGLAILIAVVSFLKIDMATP